MSSYLKRRAAVFKSSRKPSGGEGSRILLVVLGLLVGFLIVAGFQDG